MKNLKILAALTALLVTTPLWAQKELRVFISADMEGITGVVNVEQLGPSGFEYALFRKLMTAEVNAAIDGALDAGATQITVADSHGNGLSVLPDELNPKARLIRSWPRPLGMMQGVQDGFDAAFFIGYHAAMLTEKAVRAHSYSSARYYDFRLNGARASEGMLNAAIAGHYGVPVALVTGDDATIAELQKTVDANITGVVVKRAIGYHSADNLSPQLARQQIREAAKTALTRLGAVKPFTLAKPVKLEIAFKNMINAEVLSFLSIVERVDGSTIAYTGKDIIEVMRFAQVVGNYNSEH